jgi:hypothetical protein
MLLVVVLGATDRAVSLIRVMLINWMQDISAFDTIIFANCNYGISRLTVIIVLGISSSSSSISKTLAVERVSRQVS